MKLYVRRAFRFVEAKLKQSRRRQWYKSWFSFQGEMLSVLLVALLGYNFRSKLWHKLKIWTSALVLLPFCAPQASSVLETRRPKETTDSWIRFKRSVGSARTLVTSEEIRVASQYLDLGSELPASACWLCPTTQKVRKGHLALKTQLFVFVTVSLSTCTSAQRFRLFEIFVPRFYFVFIESVIEMKFDSRARQLKV